MRKMVAFLLSFAMICTISAHSFAAEFPYNENESRVVYSWENPNWQEEAYEGTGADTIIDPRYGEREEVTIIGTEQKIFYTDPENQPKFGYKFSGSASGGSVFIDTRRGSPVEVNLNLGWGPISISVAPGWADRDSVGGLSIDIPNDGYSHKVKLVYTCIFTHKKIDQYKGPEYLNTVYVTDYEVVNIEGMAYRVVW